MRLLISGSSKTGSTILAYRLLAALPGHTLIFEPQDLDSVPPQQSDIIVKYIWPINEHQLSAFDKRVLLIRHPFDIIVSTAMFLSNARTSFLVDDAPLVCFQSLRNIEERNETANFRDFWNLLEPLQGRASGQLFDQFSRVATFYKTSGSQLHLFSYEDMCREKYASINDYLGVSIDPDHALAGSEHRHVARSRSYGDWKNWFNPGDVKYFGSVPEIRDYAETFEYDLSFDSNHLRNPNPEIGSKYFRGIINIARLRWGVPLFDPNQLSTDSGAEAFLRSAEAHECNNPDVAMEQAVISLIRAPNNPGYLNHIARLLYRRELIEGAQNAVEAAIALKPEIPFSWSLLAGCYARQNKLTAAIDAIEQASSLAPEIVNTHFDHANRLRDLRSRLHIK